MAAGFLEIAVANMANAIKKISVQRGYDVTRYVLATFGGAGGQHACAVADALGMTKVLIHPLAGVLSAYGMGLADVTAMREPAVEAPLSETPWLTRLDRVDSRLEAEARAELAADGDRPASTSGPCAGPTCGTRAPTPRCRPAGRPGRLMGAFEAAYRQHFSFLMPDKAILLEAVSVELTVGRGSRRAPARPADAVRAGDGRAGRPGPRVPMFTGGAWADVDLLPRRGTAPRQRAGRARADRGGLRDHRGRAGLAGRADQPGGPAADPGRPAAGRRAVGTAVDPVLLEIFNNLFMSVAEQMGVRLRSTAHSVNIKERLDFSCAVFDAAGGLIANAPHMPVHLGSMGESIKMVAAATPGPCGPVTCTCSTTPTTAARTCPTSPWSPRCSAPAAGPARSCSTSPRAATTPRSAGSRRARCRRSAPGSRRRAC